MLRDCSFNMSYSSGLIEPKEFFTEALVESTTFDLGLGFFSSSGIRSLAYGFALFIANGGRMRIVINDILSENDKKAIEKGVSEQVHFEEKTLQNVSKLIGILSEESEQFFKQEFARFSFIYNEVFMVNDEVYGNATVKQLDEVIDKYIQEG